MKRARLWSLMLCGAIAAVGACASGGALLGPRAQVPEELRQPLEYVQSSQPHAFVRGLRTKSLELRPGPVDGVTLPDSDGSDALFAKWPTPLAPEGFLWVALTRQTKDGVYNTLSLDADGNGVLDDNETVTDGSANGGGARFERVPVTSHEQRDAAPYEITFRYARRDGESLLYVWAGGWHEGTITVDGKEKFCAVVDNNANGRFDDRSIDFAECDLIQIAERGARDVCLVGEFIQVDEILYRLTVAPDGSYVALDSPGRVRFGALRVPEEITEIIVAGENGMLDLKPEEGVAEVPVGSYRVYQWIAERTDDNGDAWRLKAHSMGNPEILEVTASGEIRPNVGAPITSTLNVRSRDGVYRMSHVLQGQPGERIQLTRNGAALMPPKICICNAAGSYDRTFAFRRG